MTRAPIPATAAARTTHLRPFGIGPSALRRLRPIAKQKQGAPNLDAIAALEHPPSTDRLAINQYLPPRAGADEEIRALVPDVRVMGEHGLVAEQPDVVFL